MDDLGYVVPGGADVDLAIGPALAARLAELACAASQLDGDAGRLADRGFAALAADIAVALPPSSRRAFLAFCRRLRMAADRGG